LQDGDEQVESLFDVENRVGALKIKKFLIRKLFTNFTKILLKNEFYIKNTNI